MSLADTVQILRDPTLRSELTALPIDRQHAIQEEVLGKIIIDPDFQTVMQHDQGRAVQMLYDFRQTLPVQPLQPMPEQEALEAPGSDFEPTRIFPDAGPGPILNKAIDVLKGLFDPAMLMEPESIVAIGGGSRFARARGQQRIATEADGVKPPPELKAEPVKAPTATDFPPAEPPKAFTRPPTGQLPPELGEQRVNLQTATQVKEAVLENVQALGQTDSSAQGRRVMHQVVEALDKGLIEVDRIPDILARSQLSMREFADELLKTYSTAGKQLQQLSQIRKRLDTWAKVHPDAADALKSLERQLPEDTVWGHIKQAYRAIDNPRRGLMVGQLATAVRNFFSQGLRYGVEALDVAAEQLFAGKGTSAAMEQGMQFIHSLNPKSRASLERILKDFPLEAEVLAGSPVGELTLTNRITKMLNVLNVAQEQFYRRATFDAVLKNELRAAGHDVTAMLAHPENIPEPIIQRAVQDAMEVTFAAAPKPGTFGAGLLQAYHALPMLTTVNPYPRFWANAMDFLATHNPASVLKLLSRDAEGEFLAANPQRRAEILARATTGTAMLAGAIALQQAGARGGKWYQLQLGDQSIDLRAYAPFNNYMFIADVLDVTAQTGGAVLDGKGLKQALIDSKRYTGKDIVQGLLGMNQIAGTGLIFTDVLQEGSTDRQLDMLANFASQYIGSFTVPVRTLKDAVAGFSAEEAKVRDVREDILGPAKANIPFISQTLPEKPSPLQPDQPKTEHPILRQLTGLSVRTANVIGTEMDRLGIGFESVRSMSGIPEVDRQVDAVTGKMVDQSIRPFVESEGYQRLKNPSVKRFLLQSALSYVRGQARHEVVATRPDLATQLKVEAVPAQARDLILSLTGHDIRKAVKP